MMEQATHGSSFPIFLGDLPELGKTMTEEEAKSAYNYLRGKGLIEPANLNYAAVVSAAGHDAIRDAQKVPDKTSPAFPSITYNYYMSVGSMTGSNVQQGASHSQIIATQTLTTQQLVEGVRKLVDQVERALPSSDLPADVRDRTMAALAELKAAATETTPDSGRLRRGLESLQHIMEHATGHLIAAGVLGLIGSLLHTVPVH